MFTPLYSRSLLLHSLSLLLLLIPLHTHAAGLYANTLDGQLITLDPVTAKITIIGDISHITITRGDGNAPAAIDAKHEIYYVVGHTSGQHNDSLLGLSLKDASIVRNITLPKDTKDTTTLINHDPTTGYIYIVCVMLVWRVDVHTNSITTVYEFQSWRILDVSAFSAFDYKLGLLYVNSWEYGQSGILSDTLIEAIDVNTGKIEHSITNEWGLQLYSMEYDPVSTLMYGVGGKFPEDGWLYSVVRSLNTKTKNFTDVTLLTGYELWFGIGSLNVKDRQFTSLVFKPSDEYSTDVVTVDINSGKVIYNSTLGHERFLVKYANM